MCRKCAVAPVFRTGLVLEVVCGLLLALFGVVLVARRDAARKVRVPAFRGIFEGRVTADGLLACGVLLVVAGVLLLAQSPTRHWVLHPAASASCCGGCSELVNAEMARMLFVEAGTAPPPGGRGSLPRGTGKNRSNRQKRKSGGQQESVAPVARSPNSRQPSSPSSSSSLKLTSRKYEKFARPSVTSTSSGAYGSVEELILLATPPPSEGEPIGACVERGRRGGADVRTASL